MEIIIYAAVSANGQILLTSPDGYQVPTEVLYDCIGLAHQTGNMVVGFNTYRLFFSDPNALEAFKGVEVTVLSDAENIAQEGVTFLNSTEAVIEYYKAKGHSKIFVAGGAKTYQLFANKGYADELYLNYIPMLSGSGVPIVTNAEVNKSYALVEHKVIAENIVQLHYKVNG